MANSTQNPNDGADNNMSELLQAMRNPSGEVDDIPEAAEIIRYLRQTAEADEKLLELAEESVLVAEMRTLEEQDRYQDCLEDIYAYEELIEAVIHHLLTLAAQYKQVPEELQYRLADMKRVLCDTQKMGRAVQEAHDKAGASLLEIKETIETIRMEQDANRRHERLIRSDTCFIKMLKSWLSLH